jgi:transketolase
LKRFRQLHGRTPGHPEAGLTPGVETTTGPLGQGLTNAVGMALAEALLAREFNRPGHTIVDHYTYVFAGDGCLMEGVSHEAASLAGTLGLNKLIVLYDDNGISIDGHVEQWFADDTALRFEAYGWNVQRGVDGHDADAVDAALTLACDSARPTLICCRTVIGHGSPAKAGMHEVHGAPLGADEVAATRRALGWPHGAFEIPDDVYAAWDARARGKATERDWRARMNRYTLEYPREAAEFERRIAGTLPPHWQESVRAMLVDADRAAQTVATRKASQSTIEALARALPELLGGSADLTGSNLTDWKAAMPVRANRDTGPLEWGNYVHYGVREFGMSAMLNGIALHGGFIPFGGTFLTFSDYARNALRMAALMKTRSIFVFTHDSIGLGEDGPTHQPVEHAASLRLIPGLDLWRPCDTVETAAAWAAAIERQGPSCLLLSRQNVPFVLRDAGQIDAIARGGYVLRDWHALADDDAEVHSSSTPAGGAHADRDAVAGAATAVPLRVVLIATGSEVELALAARDSLAQAGVAARVVSMPSTTVFDRQPRDWRDAVLPPGVPRVAAEAGVTSFWRKYVGLEGGVLGIDTFGESAPGPTLFELFGLTSQALAALALDVLARRDG